ncbi:LOW QUALITY PROTEIN: V-type proton ATPase subunit C [Frankliniella fusca]|uniref:V-type proton ATPase subunit C n=1 Tax=Frankliniella fusca TaxID=407009 RepID=A0AAE1GRN1_9NEOP|nr:LOW QUALITY PROTEIN: V-type proton ATPase subunit C [Frankliniella fusca]
MGYQDGGPSEWGILTTSDDETEDEEEFTDSEPDSDSGEVDFMMIVTGANPSEAEKTTYFASKFENCMKSLNYYECNECKEKVLIRDQIKCVHGKRCINFQACNDMDPGDVPEELSDLSFKEEQLIARVHPVLSVFKLKGIQYGYSGNVINFSQDVAAFSKKLPHRLQDLPSILVLKYENEKYGSKYFNVRASKIVKALQWLKVNNKYYCDIEICEENINDLPVNENVYGKIQGCSVGENGSIHINDNEKTSSNNDEVQDGELDFGNVIHESRMPITVSFSTEEQVESTIVDWPEMNTTPDDEYNSDADLRCQRDSKVNASDYFQHLLNYKDGRFARHPTFRFFALNSWMRWTACTTGSIMIKNVPQLKHVTVSNLKEMLKKDPSLMNKIIYQSSNIRGTKPFWSKRTGELVDMVEQLGLPTLFLTLSSADLHWPDLFRILTGNLDNSQLTEKERRDLLQNNPYAVDKRVECIIDTVICTKYNVKDYWYRVEYQHRGSPHVHGILWIKGAPNVMDIKPGDDEKLKEAEDFFSSLITAVNPDPNCECQGTHPCRTLHEDVIHKSEKEKDEDLAHLLVQCQTHTKCAENYCLRTKRGGLKQCRFKFPHTLREKGRFYFDENGELQYEPARNDPLLNKFNRFLMAIWCGNFDTSPVVSKKLLLVYLSKYISKSEIRSSSLKDLFESVFAEFSDEDNVLKPIRRLYIRTCSERDYSAQEVCHILSGRKLFSAGGRKFVVLNLNENLNEEDVYEELAQRGGA